MDIPFLRTRHNPSDVFQIRTACNATIGARVRVGVRVDVVVLGLLEKLESTVSICCFSARLCIVSEGWLPCAIMGVNQPMSL